MRRISFLLALTSLAASPAAAQHAGHDMSSMTMPGMTMPMPSKKSGQKKVKPAKKKATTGEKPGSSSKKGPTAKKAPAGHKAHGKPSMPGMEMPARGGAQSSTPGGHDMSTMPGMNTPGHDMSKMPGMEMPADQHAGHDMAGMTAPEPPVGPPPAAAFKGPENAADTVYGTAAMQPSRALLLTTEHGGMTTSKLLVDQLETRVRNGRDGYFVNAEGWHGGDIDKLWLKTEIEGDYGRKPDQAEFQALWSHAIDPWFNLQTGVRLDTTPRTRGRLVLGIQGLAPYWIEVSAAAFLSSKGDLTARIEAEHDARITQKLILQPRAQLDFALQDIPQERVGAGLSTFELGARLRYQFVPNFAPYVGLVYERSIGRTARFHRARREDPGGLQFAVGLRTWF